MRKTEFPQLLVLGVTGGIGSGKSAVCDILQRHGAQLFRADEEGKRLMTNDARVRRAVIEAFGKKSYDRSGQLNRKYLADRVFGNDAAVRQINAIVHPRVFESFTTAKKRAARDGISLLIHEAALLFEAGGDRHVDCTVYVDAPRYRRIERVMRRDGVPRDRVVARMRHQISAAEGRRRADFVVRNDSDLEALERRTMRLLKRLCKQFLDR